MISFTAINTKNRLNITKGAKMRKLNSLLLPMLVLASSASVQAQQLEEIVVTAAKRSQTLQEVPIAVSVTSGDTIEKAEIQDILDLQSVVPSLRAEQRQSSRAANFLIRGFGGGVNNPGIEPSVGIFVDGVYRSRAAAAIGDLPRLERIEVLSGPQSTLFGKNASAGVISVVTPKPSGESGGFVSLGLGNYSSVNAKGLYEGSFSDDVTFDISGSINKRDGYFDNLTTGQDLNDRDRFGVRGQLVFQISDSSELRLLADYSNLEEFCCGTGNLFEGGTVPALRALGGQLITEQPFSREQTLNVDPFAEITDQGASAQLTIDYENFTLTSITGFRKNEVFDIIDTDFTSSDIIGSGTNDIDIDTFSQEFRLTSTTSGAVDWMIGGFYFDESVDYVTDVRFGGLGRSYFDLLAGGPATLALVEAIFGLPSGTAFGNTRGVTDFFTLENEAVSLFGQLDWHLSDNLTATFGLNYTKDEKEVTYRQNNDDLFAALPFAGTPLAGLAGFQFLPPAQEFPNAIEDGTTDDDDVTYSMRLAYQITDNTNVYISTSTGFKASSWNLDRGSRPTDSDLVAIQAAGIAVPNIVGGTRFALPEESEVFEIGLKTRFNQGSLNIAIFDQSIENFQEFLFVQGARFVLSNADEQSTTGVEFDLTYYPIDELELKLAGTFLDPVYDSFPNGQGPNGPEDLTGQTPPGVHETSISFAATYNFELAGHQAFVRGDYQHENEIQVINSVPEDIASREVNQVNVSGGISTESGLSFNVWIRNLTDEEFIPSAFPTTLQFGSFSNYVNQPRTYGVTLRKDF